jgi:hypothetical protein
LRWSYTTAGATVAAIPINATNATVVATVPSAKVAEAKSDFLSTLRRYARLHNKKSRGMPRLYYYLITNV